MEQEIGKLLFEAEGKLKRDTKYVHISYAFDVENVYDKIEITLSVTPFRLQENSPALLEKMRQAVREQIFLNDASEIEQIVQGIAPARNLISLAVRSPQGWRGEDHKFMETKTVVLCEEGTTPCFTNGTNTPGKYEIILHAFAIFSETCTYQVTVRGYGDAK